MSGPLQIIIVTFAAACVVFIETNAFITTPLNFSEDHVIIYFDSNVRKDDDLDTYEQEDFKPLISKISTKFSHILTPSIDAVDIQEKSAHLEMPTAIAKYNFRLQKSSNRTDQIYIKVFLSYDVLLIENDTLFNVILDLAFIANSIYPETITGLYAAFDEDETVTLEKDLERLEKTRNTLNFPLPNNALKLATEFDLRDCGRTVMARILKQLDLVIFVFEPEQEDFEEGVDRTVRMITARFEKCRKKISQFNLPIPIELGFRTSWPDTDYNGKQNISSLVDFWGKMNDWAIETDTLVVFTEAFDQPFRDPPWNTQGWWRVVPNRAYLTSADFVFEEKPVMASKTSSVSTTIKEPVMSQPPPNATGKPFSGFTWSTAVIATLVIVLFLILVAVGALIFYNTKAMQNLGTQRVNLLTNVEIREFFKGIERLPVKRYSAAPFEPSETDKSLQNYQTAPYNNEFEVEINVIHIDESSNLGSGNFGSVCLGRVIKDSGEIQVAVKSLKRGCPATALKSLLAEIKVMSHLGRHENIVSLVGAYTKELKKGKVLVLTELCALGSLERFLRNKSNQTNSSSTAEVVNSSEEEEVAYVNVDPVEGSARYGTQCDNKTAEFRLDSKAMLRWSMEIACGMEFLASKHVVHADLATRNVLLTKEATAKISDFGLSRRLYDYTNYVKQQQEPLPWKWMAPESLSRLEFNEKSDVWAYGVTLWEIYSHGDLPYPGLSWNTRFAKDLAAGLRPDEPAFVEDGMYDLMLKCWATDANTRPRFSELKGALTTKLVESSIE